MLRDFFYYKKSDRRIILILAAGALVAAGIIIGKTSSAAHSEAENTVNKQALVQQTSHTSSDNSSATSASTSASDSNKQKTEFQNFDPNTVSFESLVSMGISEKKAQTLINYRNAGKVFREPDDLLDTYGWTNEDLASLLPYLHIATEYRQADKSLHYGQSPLTPNESRPYPSRERSASARSDSSGTSERYRSNKFKTLTRVDPNTADTTLLQRIPGIGSYYSRSIVRLRERLGGITHLEQLFEINNFPEEALQWFELPTQPAVRKMNINKASFKQLAAHPYVGYEHTKAIQNYIRLYGPITSTEQLRNIHIFTDEELNRLIPYLDF